MKHSEQSFAVPGNQSLIAKYRRLSSVKRSGVVVVSRTVLWCSRQSNLLQEALGTQRAI